MVYCGIGSFTLHLIVTKIPLYQRKDDNIKGIDRYCFVRKLSAVEAGIYLVLFCVNDVHSSVGEKIFPSAFSHIKILYTVTRAIQEGLAIKRGRASQ